MSNLEFITLKVVIQGLMAYIKVYNIIFDKLVDYHDVEYY